MKIELSLTNGKPVIKIKHYDKSSNLEDLLLGEFLKAAKKKGGGVTLKQTSGFLSTSGESWENYEIVTNG